MYKINIVLNYINFTIYISRLESGDEINLYFLLNNINVNYIV